MKITVCIGSSCHLKGARLVVDKLQTLINEKKLGDSIEMAGQFCMGECVSGVNVAIEGERFSVTPDAAQSFFEDEVLARL
ncbi:MAG: (2Fe-2S) ferredoxin domain-containing protein [Christensenellales bacterium]|jgi:NADH:ubiquinone oxidoreductase subunit E